ncbi:MAG TPA: thioredoxin family protein [bacterium]|nr:thioredoxin family protein [bacterium]HPN45952.1 thioredoxin family protein [bacterium]
MDVKVLGTGCPKCQELEKRVKTVAGNNNIDIQLEKVTDLQKIMSYGIMMTPGLVIDGEVKSAGKLPSEAEILAWLQKQA